MEQWKELIYQEVIEYERTHNTLGPGGAGAERSIASRGSAPGTNSKSEAGEDEVMQHSSATGRRWIVPLWILMLKANVNALSVNV